MKKIIVLFFSLTFIVSGLFATSDYDQGYLDGYSANQKGKANEVQIKLNEVNSNQSNYGVWKLDNIVHKSKNEFGDEVKESTYEPYIGSSNFMHGKFSSVYDDNEDFSALFLITKDYIYLKIFDYETRQIKASTYRSSEYEITIKCDDEIHEFSAENFDNKLTIFGYNDFIDILRKERPISISIKGFSSHLIYASYLLKTVTTTGFNNAYNKLISK